MQHFSRSEVTQLARRQETLRVKRKKIAFMIFAAVLAVSGFVYLHYISMIRPLMSMSATPQIRKQVELVKGLSNEDVYEIDICLCSYSRSLYLKRPRDNRDIDQLLDSLKRLSVTNTPCFTFGGDQMRVIYEDQSHYLGVQIRGDFNPKRAPYVSDALRSDDLGKVTHDVFRRKGMVPRER